MADALVFSHNPVRRFAARESELLDRLYDVLFKVIKDIPSSNEKQASDAICRARELIASASIRAAAISGSLALPPGPLGWLTIIPDLAAIWRLQAQMVADIAAVFGKKGKLTGESVIYCLFRHAAAQVARDLVIRIGERVLVRQASSRVTENVLQNIGVRIIQRITRKGIVRLLPIAGALLVAGYAYYDTEQVGQTAIDFFRQDNKFR